ncbi:hypothetical protein SLA_3056 [Streptomyces laurentii]|uniref:Uncharacterized protein n=1 Tax=Streptomyces laurentii TaxID=39478 RepID=A0A160P0Q3_STRLU|nr:hypothetical protein SLA_3056 [Streptomyces laurentii]
MSVPQSLKVAPKPAPPEGAGFGAERPTAATTPENPSAKPSRAPVATLLWPTIATSPHPCPTAPPADRTSQVRGPGATARRR